MNIPQVEASFQNAPLKAPRAQPSREPECGGPQRQRVPGIKPTDLHEIALYLCGARTKREAERVFSPVGKRIGGKKEKMKNFIPPPPEKGEWAPKSDI